jgi:signal peptidase I
LRSLRKLSWRRYSWKNRQLEEFGARRAGTVAPLGLEQVAAKRKTAKRSPRRPSPSAGRSRLRAAGRRRWLLILLAVVIGSAVVRSWFLQGYTIPSRSMEDTLLLGDCVLVEKLSAAPTQSGDVVVFVSPEDPERVFIKRCVAVAGQRIEVRDKVVFVDGERLPDPRFSKYLDARVLPATAGQRDNLPAQTVPPGQVFVMGDNRDNSRDSRHWGFLSLHAVVGRPVLVYFSAHPPDTDAGFMARLTSLPGRIRWDRIGAGTW